jgi:MFS family permease
VRLDILFRLPDSILSRFIADGEATYWAIPGMQLVRDISIPMAMIGSDENPVRVIWGVILTCHAATKNFTGIMIARFFLGAAEAAVSPGFSMMTGMWYKRSEQPLRHGFWFAGNSIAIAFGGLLSYGIAHISGTLAAWKVSSPICASRSVTDDLQWLYIIYGLITLFWAVALFFFLPDSPTSARFLTEKEGQEAENRLRVNQTGLNDNQIKWEQVWEALKDYKIWILFLYQLANNIPNGGLTTVCMLEYIVC